MGDIEDIKGIQDVNALKIAKLCVALAIIRSKPVSRNAREHAEHLAALYSTAQHRWKDRLGKAQAEILSLKQQILLSSGASQTLSDVGPCCDSQPIYPTPPSDIYPTTEASNQTEADTTQNNPLVLNRDITFLHHVLSLHRIGTTVLSQSQDATASSNSTGKHLELTEVTQITLEHSLDCVRDILSAPTETVSASLVSQALASVVRVLERVPTDQWYVRCQGILMDIMSQVIDRFLAMDPFEEVSDIPHTRLLELLACFYRTSSLDLLHAALTVLCTRIDTFCATLRDHKRDFCPVAAENICRLISALDTCVQQNRMLLSSKDGHAVCARVEAMLEASLLHLTHTHPLLAHAIWKVSRSMELCLSQHWQQKV